MDNWNTIQISKRVSYKMLCAITNVRLGLAKHYYMEWAEAIGMSKATANNYWNRAKTLARKDVHYY